MIASIGAALFTIVLIALILKLLTLAFKFSWGIVKGILVVAVLPCVLGGLFIIGFWYVSIPVAVILLLLAYVGKFNLDGKKQPKQAKQPKKSKKAKQEETEAE